MRNFTFKITKLTLLSAFILFAATLSAQNTNSRSDSTDRALHFRGVAEIGFIGAMSHKIQLGENGTYFDYVKNGGQDVLFPAFRFSIELDFNKRNTFILLYQPLKIKTKTLLKDNLVAYGTTFPALSSIECLYNFPFYRISYLRELTKDNEKFNFAIGASLQIRNATISFESTDGTRYTFSRGIGPVPALKFRTRLNLNQIFYAEIEADGIYAPISVLNGSDNEVEGAILDASLRIGAHVNSATNMFFNVRYLGGGAEGKNPDDPFPGDGYTKNWLHFLNISTGFILNL